MYCKRQGQFESKVEFDVLIACWCWYVFSKALLYFQGLWAKAEVFLPSVIPWSTEGLRPFWEFYVVHGDCRSRWLWRVACGMWIKMSPATSEYGCYPEGRKGTLGSKGERSLVIIHSRLLSPTGDSQRGWWARPGGEGASPHSLLASACLHSGGAQNCFGRTDPALSKFFFKFYFYIQLLLYRLPLFSEEHKQGKGSCIFFLLFIKQ